MRRRPSSAATVAAGIGASASLPSSARVPAARSERSVCTNTSTTWTSGFSSFQMALRRSP